METVSTISNTNTLKRKHPDNSSDNPTKKKKTGKERKQAIAPDQTVPATPEKVKLDEEKVVANNENYHRKKASTYKLRNTFGTSIDQRRRSC